MRTLSILSLAVFFFSLAACQSEDASTAQDQMENEAVDSNDVVNTVQEGSYSYRLNPDSSLMEWVGGKPSGTHDGQVKLLNGALGFNNLMDVEHGAIEVDMTSITCRDISDEEDNADLVKHLKNEDFFNVAEFPSASFVVASITPQDGNEFRLEGQMIIKGIAQPANTIVTRTVEDNRLIYTGSFVIDRTIYDITYKSNSIFDDLGDKFIYDEFTLNFKLVFDPLK